MRSAAFRTRRAHRRVQPTVDGIERAAIAADGYDLGDPAVVAALARVSALLAALGRA
jgi:hypothetical protein